MDFFQTIRQRRSIRKYQPDPIPDEHLTQMLEAAQLAPSAGNYQPWKFVVVRDPKTIKDLARAARKQNFLRRAAAIIIAFADANVYLPPPPLEPGFLMIPPCFEIDVMIAIEHIILAATALGYGSCWVGAFDESEVNRNFHWGVIIDSPTGDNLWAIPTEINDHASNEFHSYHHLFLILHIL